MLDADLDTASASHGHGRTPPHNEDAEKALLGGLLLDPLRVPEVAEEVGAGDFYSPRIDAVYQALLDLAEKSQPIDYVSVGEALLAAQKLAAVGGRSYLVEL